MRVSWSELRMRDAGRVREAVLRRWSATPSRRARRASSTSSPGGCRRLRHLLGCRFSSWRQRTSGWCCSTSSAPARGGADAVTFRSRGGGGGAMRIVCHAAGRTATAATQPGHRQLAVHRPAPREARTLSPLRCTRCPPRLLITLEGVGRVGSARRRRTFLDARRRLRHLPARSRSMETAEFQAAGLYDPGSPNAADRLAHPPVAGGTRATHSSRWCSRTATGRWSALAAVRRCARRRFTVAEVAAQIGIRRPGRHRERDSGFRHATRASGSVRKGATASGCPSSLAPVRCRSAQPPRDREAPPGAQRRIRGERDSDPWRCATTSARVVPACRQPLRSASGPRFRDPGT